MGRIFNSGVNGASSGPILTTLVTTGEAVSQGQLAVIAQDNLAYYAADPSVLANASRPVYTPYTNANVFLNATPIVPGSATSGAVTSAVPGIATLAGALLTNGNFVVTWMDASSTLIKFAIFDANGIQQGSTVSIGNSAPTDTTQFNITVCALTGGGFAIAYGFNLAPWAQYAVYDNSGAVVKALTTVDASLSGTSQLAVKAIALSNGNFAICYVGPGVTALFRIYTSAGVLSVGPTTIDASGMYYIEAVPFSAALGGGFVVAYASSGTGTMVAKYTNAGAVSVSARATGGGNYQYSNVCALTGGGFAVVIASSGPQLKLYNTAGTLLATCLPGSTQSTFVFQPVGLSNGNVAFVGLGNTGNNTVAIFNGLTGDRIGVASNTVFPMNVNSNCVFCALPNHYGGLSVIYGGGGGTPISGGFDANCALVAPTISPPSAYLHSGSTPQVFFALPSGTTKSDIAIYMKGGALGIGFVNFYQQKITPVGVFAATAGSGSSVTVQYTGAAVLATQFAAPYAVDGQRATPPGQRMNVIGNSVYLNGIQANSALASRNIN